jgi:hypothetical protein
MLRNFACAGLLLLVTTTFAGCSNFRAKVARKAGDKFIVLATSNDEADAMNGAHETAKEHCTERGGKKAVVLKEKSEYQGPDKTVRGVANLVGALAGTQTTMNNHEDYKVKLLFKCQ